MSDLFYLQDSRSNVGTGATWWAKDGKGYTTNLDKAEQFTRDRAVGQYECRETDLPWPKAYIDERHHVGVDCQYVKPDESALAADGERRFYAAYRGEWNGNDLRWLAKTGGRTSNLNNAKQFSVDHVPGLSARGYQALPATYIDGKSRRLVSVERMNHMEALRTCGLKLKKIKPQKIRRNTYRCEPCGRFLTQRQNYDECPNCGAENRP